MWQAYIELGLRHILDVRAYDHLLFILALCAVYRFDQWKRLLLPITAFTLGHSVSLALSATKVLFLPGPLIETLIPITILITAISNLTIQNKGDKPGIYLYLTTLFFGLIHGFGFAQYFLALLSSQHQIIMPLVAFNIGVEFGQLVIIGGFFVLTYLVTRLLGMPHKYWNYLLSSCIAIMSAWLIFFN